MILNCHKRSNRECVWLFLSMCCSSCVSNQCTQKKSHQPSLCLGTIIMQRSEMLFSSLTQLKFAEKTQMMFSLAQLIRTLNTLCKVGGFRLMRFLEKKIKKSMKVVQKLSRTTCFCEDKEVLCSKYASMCFYVIVKSNIVIIV